MLSDFLPLGLLPGTPGSHLLSLDITPSLTSALARTEQGWGMGGFLPFRLRFTE